MTFNGILQILLFFIGIVAVTKPMGIYLTRVYGGERTFLEPILGPIERFIYRFARVNAADEMNWKQYAVAMIFFSLVSSLAVYALQRLQFYLPLNPQDFPAPSQEDRGLRCTDGNALCVDLSAGHSGIDCGFIAVVGFRADIAE